MCIFKAVKKQSGIGFIVDALFGNFAYLHSLYTMVDVAYKLCIDSFWQAAYVRDTARIVVKIVKKLSVATNLELIV